MIDHFNPLTHSVCLDMPQRLVFPNSWVTHIPFAMYLMSALKPSIFVELGTHTGNSYCAFCQAVATLNLESKCFAVDTWEGDEHAGFYGSEVFEDLLKYHDPKYSSFSRLLKKTFDEAKDYFSDHAISLLHIDGLHTYEAVKHDFENWRQKLSDNAIVIFHDTNVREFGFGVWKFWEEIADEYPHLEFLHGNGLGIICLGQADHMGLADLFDPNNLEDIRGFFSCIGAKYNFPIELNRLHQILEKLTGDLADREQIVQKLTVDLAKRNQAHQKELQIIHDEKSRLEQELNIQVSRKAELEQSLNITNHEIVDYFNSTSWKITRPLRWINKKLRGGSV